MGNAKIGAYLPEGYIPLGSASLDGIIYIVSYNPLTKEIQFSALVLKRMENLSKEELIMYFKLNFLCEKMHDEKE